MSAAEEKITPPRKRLFISLMGLTCLILVGLIFLAWWVPNRGLANIHPNLPNIVGIVMAVLSGMAILGTGLLVLTTALGKDIFFTRFMRLVVIKFLLPVIEFVGRLLGLDRDAIRQSFIAMNNSLVISQRQKISPDRVLVLQADKKGLEVACLTGSLIIEEMQLAGKKRLDAASFLSGFAVSAGTLLGGAQDEGASR